MRDKYRPHLILEVVLLSIALAVFPAGNSYAEEDSRYLEAVREFASIERHVYKQTPQGELVIFIHLPKNWDASDKRPAIVFFFGGAFRTGTIKEFLRHAEYLASRGMVAARADYRVKNRHKNMPDKCVEDAKSTVRWLRTNAAKFGVDSNRIAASGHSAGGTLAACAYTAIGLEAKGENLSVSSKPNLLVLFNTPLNSCNYTFVSYLGSKEMAINISPNYNLTKGFPPAILFYGVQDSRHLLDGVDFIHKSKELGNVAELYAAEGQSHNFFKYSPWFERTLYLMDQFLAKHGYIQGEPTIELPEGKVEMGKMTPDSLDLKERWNYTALHHTARNSDKESVKALIARGANVSAQDNWGNTPLHYAVMMPGDVELVQTLIDGGADLNVHGKLRGNTPLHYAVSSGNKNMVDILVSNGADLSLESTSGNTPIDVASRQDRDYILRLFMDKGADIFLIHVAAGMGDLTQIKAFIENGIDVNTRNKDGFTPLYAACSRGHADVVKFLIDNGADVNAKDDYGQAPIDVAAERNRRNLVQLLVAKGAEISTIHLAAYLGDVTKVEGFIEKGVDVNIARGPKDDTPLHYAVKSRSGSVDVIKLLVDSGADVNARNTSGDTPLHYAAKYDRKDIFQLLVSKGADVVIKNDRGRTPKDIVAMRTKYLILSICAVVMPLFLGIAGAIPIARRLRGVSGRSKRFFRYFGLLIGVYLVEYLTCCAVTIILFYSRSAPPSEFVWGLASMGVLGCVWGILFGIWLRRRATARKIMKAVAFVSLYASVPIICLTVLLLVELIIIEGVNIASVENSASRGLATMPWPLNTVLGYSIALVLGVILLKSVIIAGEVGLLIRLGRKPSSRISETAS